MKTLCRAKGTHSAPRFEVCRAPFALNFLRMGFRCSQGLYGTYRGDQRNGHALRQISPGREGGSATACVLGLRKKIANQWTEIESGTNLSSGQFGTSS